MSIEQRIKAGDTVFHDPTEEQWYALGVNYERGELCVAGWPPTIGKIDDCVMVESGNGITDEERAYRDKKFGGGWE
jgi:hypothetical protein